MEPFSKIVQDATELKALPGSTLRLTSLLANDDWAISDIVDTISHDPVLTGRLMSLANSAAMGPSSMIGTVSEAVMRVGPNPVLSLAMAAAVGDELIAAMPTFGASEGVLWRHSIAASLAVSKFARYFGQTPPPETHVATLLHDIGFLVLDRWVHSFPAGAKRERVQARVGELDHAALGGLLAQQWKMPECVQLGITHHHHPNTAPDESSRLIASYVAVADCVAQRIDAGFGADKNRVSMRTSKRLQLTRRQFEDLCTETSDGLDEFLELHS